jgi:hypothetical protein
MASGTPGARLSELTLVFRGRMLERSNDSQLFRDFPMPVIALQPAIAIIIPEVRP